MGLPLIALGGGQPPIRTARFDGVNYLPKSTVDLTSNADSKVGTVFIAAKFQGTNATNQDFFTNARAKVRRNTSNKFTVELENSAGNTILFLRSQTSVTDTSGFVTFIASWDLAAGATHLYVNGVDDEDGTTSTTDQLIDYTVAAGYKVFGTPDTVHADVHAFYFNNAEYMDLSSAPNRAKFIDANNRPMDLGATAQLPTGSQPIFCFQRRQGSALSTFTTNKGYGGQGFGSPNTPLVEGDIWA